MLKKIAFAFLVILGIGFIVYLSFPGPDFPAPPPDALQSREPADSETPLRRAYFTNLSREEVVSHYETEFGKGVRLNHPPEESAAIIRDQTRSTFLEEIVHPFRESIYINGFEPKNPKDAIEIGGLPWRQKIIIRYVETSVLIRLLVAVMTIVCTYLVAYSLSDFFRENYKYLFKK